MALSKGNPAGTRMSNPRLKARRQECWARGCARKAANRAANEARAAANILLREAGQLTPHELQKQKRRRIRDTAREAGLLPPIGTTRTQWNLNKKAGTS